MKYLLISFLSFCVISCSVTSQPAEIGYVKLMFDINTDAQPENIQVIESYPEGMFEQEAISAIKQWKYQIKIVNGNPMLSEGHTVQLDFPVYK